MKKNVNGEFMENEILLDLKEQTQQVRISENEIDEIIPDADFRFSLIIMKNGDKHFVCGTKEELQEKFTKAANQKD